MIDLSMIKKSKKKSKTTVNKKFSREIENLRTDLKYTLRAIDGKSILLDEIFINQSKKIQLEIEKLVKKQ